MNKEIIRKYSAMKSIGVKRSLMPAIISPVVKSGKKDSSSVSNAITTKRNLVII